MNTPTKIIVSCQRKGHLMVAEILNPSNPNESIVLSSVSVAVFAENPAVRQAWEGLVKQVTTALIQESLGIEVLGIQEVRMPAQASSKAH